MTPISPYLSTNPDPDLWASMTPERAAAMAGDVLQTDSWAPQVTTAGGLAVWEAIGGGGCVLRLDAAYSPCLAIIAPDGAWEARTLSQSTDPADFTLRGKADPPGRALRECLDALRRLGTLSPVEPCR